MAQNITLPRLGISMIDARIVEWKVKEGDWVTAGQPLVLIETEKVSYELPSAAEGFAHIVATQDEVVPVDGVLAVLASSQEEYQQIQGETPSTDKVEAGAARAPSGVPARAGSVAVGEPNAVESNGQEQVRVSPLARKMAQELRVDLSQVKGTGPGGRILREDIVFAKESQMTMTELAATEPGQMPEGLKPAPHSKKIVPVSTMRRTIARRMTQSVQTAPHFWVTADADATELLKLHKQLAPTVEKKAGVKLTLTDVLIRIVAVVLVEHPHVNASWTDEGIELSPEVNIGVATDVPEGLVVPVLLQADKKSLAEIASTRAELVNRGRTAQLSLDEITGSTFTLNNVGALGIKCVDAIINPPESAILSIGAITERAVVVDGAIVVRAVMDMSLAADHRTLDGSSAGRFLRRVKEVVENPAHLIV